MRLREWYLICWRPQLFSAAQWHCTVRGQDVIPFSLKDSFLIESPPQPDVHDEEETEAMHLRSRMLLILNYWKRVGENHELSMAEILTAEQMWT